MLYINHWIVDFYHEPGHVVDLTPPDQYWFVLFRQPLSICQDGRMVSVAADCCIFYEPGVRRYYYNDTAGYYHEGFFFSGEDLSGLLDQLGIPRNTPFYVKDPAAISRLIRELVREKTFHQSHSDVIIDLRIRLLMHTLVDAVCIENEEVRRYAQLFFKLQQRIFQAPEQAWRADKMAAEMFLSPSRFHHLYKEVLSSTMKQDLISSRLGRAKYLLRCDSCSVAEIAAACGYNNEEHFFRQFKKYTGITPGHYRRHYAIEM